MRKLVVVLLVLVLAGCAVRTPSLVDSSRQVTPQQLNLEVATIKAKLEVQKAVIEEKKITAAASIEKDLAVYNAEVAAVSAKIEAANADIAEKYEQRDFIFNTVTSVVSAVVPPPYAGFAVLGIGIAGSIFGMVKRKETATAVSAVDTMAKAIKTTNSTQAATAVQNAVMAADVSALIDSRVKMTGSDLL